MKSIIFNTEDIQAVLDGRKSATRKIIQGLGNGWHVNKLLGDWALSEDPFIEKKSLKWVLQTDVDDNRMFTTKLPYQVGDILYVKETWCELCHVNADGITHYDKTKYFYKTDGDYQIDLYDDDGHYLDDQKMKWKPSIHMPKDAARIFLKVTDVRVERLQDITTEECIKEGEIPHIHVDNSVNKNATRTSFIGTWNDRHGKSQDAWINNPWVWVIEFERISKEEI